MNIPKILLLICGVLLIVIGVPRLVLNTWVPYSNYFFYGALILFAVAGAFSYKNLLDFFSMRTTKYGLNMGTLIFLGLVLFLCINFFAFRYDKSIDITQDKLNSLSLQSLEVLDNLKSDVEFKVFYQGKMHSNENIGLKLLFKKYKRESSKIKSRFIDAHKDPLSANYLDRSDKGQIAVFATQGHRKEKVKTPVTEESLTSALFRLAQKSVKKIYFLTGHGERSFEVGSLSLLKSALEDKGFLAEELNLATSLKVPEDASLIAVLGPQKALLKEELEALIEYTHEGGRLFLASDPQQKDNLSEMTKLFAIEIPKNYLLSTQTVMGGDALTVVGQEFSKSEITKDFEKNAITLFYETSEVKKRELGPRNYKLTDLVSTPPVVLEVKNLSNYQDEVQGQKPESYTLGILSEGNTGAHEGHNHGDEEDTDFMVAVFGDSDFLTDSYFEIGFNKDLALNAFASLSGQQNLISIRPRAAKDTKIILTSTHSAFVIMFPLLIPLLLLISSMILWFRKRGA